MERQVMIEPDVHDESSEPQRPPAQPVAGKPDDGFTGPLLAHDASDEMRSRWESIQTRFVDDPSSAVRDADELVSSAIKRLSETFANERANLERQWSQGKDASTEDLRLALRRYRAFFQRLLAV